MEYYGIAVRENPDDPKPWLNMFDIAFASDQLDAAERILADAERRGADSGEIDERKTKLGIGTEDGLRSRPVIIE